MPLARRGTIYRFDGGSSDLYGALVLTNDVWNRRMASIGVVPVRLATDVGSLWEPVVAAEPRLQARIGFLAAQPKERLLEARFVLAPDQLTRAASALAELFAWPDLAAMPPVPPKPVSGPADYPAWAEV